MRAVVTGGSGFLGSHLVDRLLDQGHEVLVLDNFITGRPENLVQHTHNARLEVRRADVTEFIAVDGPVDYVFHFASPASPADFVRFPIQVLKAGALGTHKALGLAKHKGAKFLLASTSEVYGDPHVHPQPETYWGNVNPIGPRGVYDESKRYAEAMTMAYAQVHGVSTRIVRIFNTYGPRMRLDDGRVVPEFVRCILEDRPLILHGDGSQTRCFSYVTDTLEAILRISELDYDQPVNVGSDLEITVLELANTLEQVVGHPLERRFAPPLPDDPRRRRPDLGRLHGLAGVLPATPLAEGLSQTLRSFGFEQ